jgi:hypothetical protein
MVGVWPEGLSPSLEFLRFGCGPRPDQTLNNDSADHLYGYDLASSGSTLCLSRGKPVVYCELRRELGLKWMPLEANVEPELEGQVMSAFICEVRTQFLIVAFAQQLRTEMEAFCQKSHVITILLHLPSTVSAKSFRKAAWTYNGLTTESYGASLGRRRSRWNSSARMAAHTKTMRCAPGCWSAAAAAAVL